MKPTMVAPQRWIPTCSPRKKIAKIVMKKVFEKPSAVASASGSLMIAVKPQSIAMVAKITRAICRSGRWVLSDVGRPRRIFGATMTTITSCRMTRIWNTDMFSPAILMKVAMMVNRKAASNIHKAPMVLGGRSSQIGKPNREPRLGLSAESGADLSAGALSGALSIIGVLVVDAAHRGAGVFEYGSGS